VSSSPTLSADPQAASSREASLLLVVAFVVASLVFHVVGFVALGQLSPPRHDDFKKPVELVMFEVAKPPPPPEPPKIEEPAPKPKVKPAPIKVAEVKPPPEPPKEQLPPPPNDAPPPEANKPVPLVVGISMSSTTTAGGFAAPVGNTVYGKTAKQAVAPSEVKAYSAPKYMPAYQVDTPPSVLGECRGEYPEDAKRLGIEGTVMLSVLIDTDGVVKNVKLLHGLGYGLDEVAQSRIKKCRFEPAHKGGEAVSTEITYKFTFLID
jgi:periplasmic protein TonB